MKTLKIGLAGCGTVGSAVVWLLFAQRALFEALDIELEWIGIWVRDADKPRHLPGFIPLFEDPRFLEEADVLIEAMGGTDEPLRLWLPHLRLGKPVITANKAVLALHWEEVWPHLLEGQIYFEASVMAGTPVIAALSTVLRGTTPVRLEATLNGTCNYILSEMEAGVEYDQALKAAQRLGYAEADPSLDVGGSDSAHKLAVLARLCVDPHFPLDAIEVQGIDRLSRDDIAQALASGQKTRLLCTLALEGSVWKAQVRPTRLDRHHPISKADSSFNALMFVGQGSGPVLLMGNGAGGEATASAIVGDLLSFCMGVPGPRPALVRRH